MNALQRWVVGVRLFRLVALVLVPPWDTVDGVIYHPIPSAPRRSSVSAVRWTIPMLVVLVVTRCLYAMAARPPTLPLPPMTGPHNPLSEHTQRESVRRLRGLGKGSEKP